MGIRKTIEKWFEEKSNDSEKNIPLPFEVFVEELHTYLKKRNDHFIIGANFKREFCKDTGRSTFSPTDFGHERLSGLFRNIADFDERFLYGRLSQSSKADIVLILKDSNKVDEMYFPQPVLENGYYNDLRKVLTYPGDFYRFAHVTTGEVLYFHPKKISCDKKVQRAYNKFKLNESKYCRLHKIEDQVLLGWITQFLREHVQTLGVQPAQFLESVSVYSKELMIPLMELLFENALHKQLVRYFDYCLIEYVKNVYPVLQSTEFQIESKIDDIFLSPQK